MEVPLEQTPGHRVDRYALEQPALCGHPEQGDTDLVARLYSDQSDTLKTRENITTPSSMLSKWT